MQHLFEDQAGGLPQQRSASLRDAATLTEDKRGLHRDLRITEVKTLSPEEDEEQSSLREHERLGRPFDQESEEEELELIEGRTGRHPGVRTIYEKRRFITDSDDRYSSNIHLC